MTDREAIQRLANAVVLDHTGNRADAALEYAKLIADLDGPEQGCAFALCADCNLHIQPEWCRCQDEPAATTDRTKLELDAYNRGHVAGLAAARKLNDPASPAVTQIEEAFDRGYEQARRDLVEDSLKAVLHPTVTREQAEHVRNAIIVWLGSYGSMHGFHDLFTEAEEVAFFRAVADQLDKL